MDETTVREVFEREIAGKPQWREAPRRNASVIIVGARPNDLSKSFSMRSLSGRGSALPLQAAVER
jgi:hypothetical protein